MALTDIEKQCGVDAEQVTTAAAQAYVFEDGERVALAANLGPALAGAAARHKLGRAVSFLGLNTLGMPVYGTSAA